MSKKNCYLIGNTFLLIHCIETLLQNDFEVSGICTSDPDVISWSSANNIKHLKNIFIKHGNEAKGCECFGFLVSFPRMYYYINHIILIY